MAQARWPSLVVIACAACAAALFLKHTWSLGHRRNALDRLAADLAPMREAVAPGRSIGFVTDLQGDARKVLLHQVQFALAPRVVVPGDAPDTVLAMGGTAWLHGLKGATLFHADGADGRAMRLVARNAQP